MILTQTYLYIFLLLILAWHDLAGMVENCPYTISNSQQKVIAENRKNLSKTIETLVDLIGKNAQEPYDLRCTDLTGIDLSSRMLKFIDLSGARLDNAILFNTEFDNVNFAKASFKNSQLSRTRFWDSTIEEADFSNVTMPDTQFLGSTRRLSAARANFNKANISAGSEFKNVDLRGTLFDDAYLYFSGFTSVIVNQQTSFKRTNMRSCAITNMIGAPDAIKKWLQSQNALIENMTIDSLDVNISTKT